MLRVVCVVSFTVHVAHWGCSRCVAAALSPDSTKFFLQFEITHITSGFPWPLRENNLNAVSDSRQKCDCVQSSAVFLINACDGALFYCADEAIAT